MSEVLLYQTMQLSGGTYRVWICAGRLYAGLQSVTYTIALYCIAQSRTLTASDCVRINLDDHLKNYGD